MSISWLTDDEGEISNIAYDPNIGIEADQLEHEDDAEFANVGYDPNIGIGYVNINSSNAVMFGGKWIEKMWQGKAAYNGKGGVDDYMQFLQDQQTKEYKASVEQLGENHSRTNDLLEYQQHAQVFRQVSPDMVKQAYSENVMDAKRRKENRKQQFYRSICNRILSMCDAIAPDKTGAPILVIGKATFSSTMKGKRAAPVKKVMEYLSKFFTVITILFSM